MPRPQCVCVCVCVCVRVCAFVTAPSLLTPAHNLQSVQTACDPSCLNRCTQFAIAALTSACTLCPDISFLPSYLPCPFPLRSRIRCCHNSSLRWSRLCPPHSRFFLEWPRIQFFFFFIFLPPFLLSTLPYPLLRARASLPPTPPPDFMLRCSAPACVTVVCVCRSKHFPSLDRVSLRLLCKLAS